MIALRVGVDDLEEHLRWFRHIVRRDEEVEIKSQKEGKINCSFV